MDWRSEELGSERRVVETARDPDGEAFGWEPFDDHRNAIRERDRHDEGFFCVRTATEAVVLVRGRWSTPLLLDNRLAATQLRHEQIRSRPRQQEAGHDADDDVPADGVHWRQNTLPYLDRQYRLAVPVT